MLQLVPLPSSTADPPAVTFSAGAPVMAGDGPNRGLISSVAVVAELWLYRSVTVRATLCGSGQTGAALCVPRLMAGQSPKQTARVRQDAETDAAYELEPRHGPRQGPRPRVRSEQQPLTEPGNQGTHAAPHLQLVPLPVGSGTSGALTPVATLPLSPLLATVAPLAQDTRHS